jgi:hypothetical protein
MTLPSVRLRKFNFFDRLSEILYAFSDKLQNRANMSEEKKWTGHTVHSVSSLIHSCILDRHAESTASVFILSMLKRETLAQLCVVFRIVQFAACACVLFLSRMFIGCDYSVFLCVMKKVSHKFVKDQREEGWRPFE